VDRGEVGFSRYSAVCSMDSVLPRDDRRRLLRLAPAARLAGRSPAPAPAGKQVTKGMQKEVNQSRREQGFGGALLH
jgi:hypothetical protein